MKRIYGIVLILIVLAAFTPLCCFADDYFYLSCEMLQALIGPGAFFTGSFGLTSDTCDLGDKSINFINDFTLDLSGKSLTAEAIRCSGNSCSLTIENTTGTGKLSSGIFITGDVTIEGGIVEASGSLEAISGNNVTISGGKVTATGTGSVGYGIRSTGTITISGDQTQVTATGGQYGIYASSDNVTNAANVTIEGGTVTATGESGSGIYARDNIYISDGTVNATATGNNINGIGINAGKIIAISGGEVTAAGGGNSIKAAEDIAISGGKVTATGGSLQNIYAQNYIFISGGEVTATGGNIGIYAAEDTVTISGGSTVTVSGNYNGIYAAKDITISDSTVKAASESYGIYAAKDITISGSSTSVEATGEGDDGICAVGNIKIEGGTVKASGNVKGTTGDTKSGIYADSVTISGGMVTATGNYNGIYAVKDITISGGTVEATGTDYGIKCGYLDTDVYTLVIGEGVTSLTAKGNSLAVKGIVRNAVPCTGWTDTDGTGNGTEIDRSESGQSLTYKKVQFPPQAGTTAPAAKNLTYNGSAQELVTAGEASGGTMQYALGTDGTAAPADGDWGTAIPTGTDAKTYYVWYKAVGDDNHTDSEPEYVQVTIAPRSVTVTATAEDKVYDGTVKAVLKGTPVLSGIVEGDDIDVTVGDAKFKDPSAGQDKTVTISGFSLTGEDEDNYKLSGQPADATASIAKRPVTITAAAEDKVYDGTVKAVLKGTPVLNGIIEGDDVSVTVRKAVFEDPSAGQDKTVTFSGFSLTGEDKDNYELSEEYADATASIAKRSATVTAVGQSINKGETIKTGPDLAKLEGAVDGNVLSAVTLTANGTQIIPSDAKIAQGSAQPKGDYTAPYDVDVTDNYDITYVPGTLTVNSDTVSYQVTFKVMNGAWNDGSRADVSVTLSGNEGDTLTLPPDRVPEAGSAPDEGFKAGGWDREPDTQTPLTGNVTYIYTYEPDEAPEPERPRMEFFRLHADCELPATGFSSLRPTVLPEQPKDLRYEPARMVLMIPALDREIELVTMPREGNSWAAARLGADAGILEGSALPGEGVSIIAAHNTLNDTDYGPFALLGTLDVNDTVMVREESGALKLFRVYANELLEPDDMERLSALAGEDALVLFTCENESPAGGYLNRRAVFAR